MNQHLKIDPGMSDDQLANERDAQWHYKDMLDTVRKRIRTINAYSSVVQINMTAWENFVHDDLPAIKDWDEKITEARHG